MMSHYILLSKDIFLRIILFVISNWKINAINYFYDAGKKKHLQHYRATIFLQLSIFFLSFFLKIFDIWFDMNKLDDVW